MKRRIFLGALVGFTARPGWAAQKRYLLDTANSRVSFTYRLNGQKLTGNMPVKSADIILDVDRPANSRVSAILDAKNANAGPFYATSSMKGPDVLATDRFPEIGFVSSAIRGTARQATVTGLMTIRDTTKEITLNATLFRQRGTEEGDRRKMSIQLTGKIDRHAFGASGFPGLVAPEINLNILTRINLPNAG